MMRLCDAAITAGAAVATGSMLLSGAIIWLMLTRPMAVVDPVGGSGPVAIVRTAVMTLHDKVVGRFIEAPGERP